MFFFFASSDSKVLEPNGSSTDRNFLISETQPWNLVPLHPLTGVTRRDPFEACLPPHVRHRTKKQRPFELHSKIPCFKNIAPPLLPTSIQPLYTMRNTLIFAGSSCPILTNKICENLGMPPAEAELSQFSNVSSQSAALPRCREPITLHRAARQPLSTMPACHADDPFFVLFRARRASRSSTVSAKRMSSSSSRVAPPSTTRSWNCLS